MSKETLSHEIARELEKLNDTIDRKIIKGRPYHKEAQRHKELSITLERIRSEGDEVEVRSRRIRRAAKSPVRRRLERGAFSRLFGFGMAA